MTKIIGYIGTYSTGNSKGLYTFTLDTEKQTLSNTTVAAELEKPTYVAISKDNKYLYSLIKKGDSSGVASYSINPQTGALSFINSQVSEGVPPCHISLNKNNDTIFTANYHRSIIEAYPVINGELQPVAAVAQHEGNGPHERQEKAHAHFAGFTPDEQYVVSIDLGADQINTFSFKENTFTKLHTLSTRPGSGPRHITFHPNGKYAYVMTELSSEVIVLAYNAENGSFKEIQYISTLPAEFTGNGQGSAIHISSDGRYIYAGNRGSDDIAVFSVNDSTGELTLVENVSTEGNWPRDFALDPTEKFLIASNQESDNLTLYARDEATGKLTLLQANVAVPNPVCVKFLNI
ncbi:lactonase family protein [Bacillus massiliigorillae]|uniref:lactonase family protein n=1 Tax=Bacillus massiliigorillae TaxID=1243664 RepID=UPI0003A52940|nr:lactonase family protein [Bacillus massiliigorillae]